MKQLEDNIYRENYEPIERTPEEQERIDKWIEIIREGFKKNENEYVYKKID